eukprot:GFYU01007206.1.p1 GENE.GFYU01007206.1~~GFYU01007206.1.p1  ORF type:complete len:252 (+),score=68.73 GFYU01007206.1:185-940(+)
MAANYLEDYLLSVSTLPMELNRNFALMRELDQKVQGMQGEVQGKIKTTVQKAKNQWREKAIDPETQAKTVEAHFQHILELCEQKIALAEQSYEAVDNHIRRLDADLQNFECDLRTTIPDISIAPEPEPPTKKKRKAEPAEGATPVKRQKSVQKKTGAAPAVPPVVAPQVLDVAVMGVPTTTNLLNLPVDPNEPVYCVCRGVSFGEMIACDDDECLHEWFHPMCVGLSPTNLPTGTWYCEECTRRRAKNNKK